MLQRTTFLAAATVLLAACAPGTETALVGPTTSGVLASKQVSAEPATITVGYFSVQPNYAFAQKKGFFAQENLTVIGRQTPSSPVIFKNLRDGNWQIILTQIDNVFNYRYNASNPHSDNLPGYGYSPATFEAVAFMGTDWGNGAALMVRPEAATCEGIRGKNVIVDSPNSGFSFVLYGILRNKCGFEPDRPGRIEDGDYNVVVTGGTPGRYADLLRGYSVVGGQQVPIVGTILNAGFEYQAEDRGNVRFGGITDATAPFMGGSAVATRQWLDANGDVAVRFVRAFAKAQAYVLDPANKAEVIQWMRDQGNSQLVAERTYATMQNEFRDGLIPDAGIDREGLFKTAELRHSFQGFDDPSINLKWLSTPASGVFDLSYWQQATSVPGIGSGRY